MCVQEQSEIIWSTRDKLSKEVSKEAMKEMLEMNDQEIPTGESKVSHLRSARLIVHLIVTWHF